MSISKQCLTCARKDKDALNHAIFDFDCEGYSQEYIEYSFSDEKGICRYYFNLYVWRKQVEEKEAEIKRRKDIARKNREKPLSYKPFKCLMV